MNGTMRWLFFVLSCIAFGTSCNTKNASSKNTISSTSKSHSVVPLLPLNNTSGYISKENGLPFLLALKLTDTTKNSWGYIKPSDTIAKYYQKDSSTYFICFFDYNTNVFDFETNILIEVKQTNKQQTIITMQRYLHGNYSCCWNGFDGFEKMNNVFIFHCCQTGSGYCANYMYVFKSIVPQNKASFILANKTSCDYDNISLSTQSNILFISDSLIKINYFFESRLKKEECFDGPIQVKRNFILEFVKHKNKWISPDSLIYDKLDFL